MKIKPMFAWYDFWIGWFWDSKKTKLYIFPLPMVGVCVDFGKEKHEVSLEKQLETTQEWLDKFQGTCGSLEIERGILEQKIREIYFMTKGCLEGIEYDPDGKHLKIRRLLDKIEETFKGIENAKEND